jgi:hypothetical protein
MAWFDRNPGGKKISDGEAENASIRTPLTPEPEPPPVAAAPKIKVESAVSPSEPRLVGHLHKGSRVSLLLKGRCASMEALKERSAVLRH